MNPTLKQVILLVFITITVFFLSNTFFGGYITPDRLGSEISASPEALYEWHLSQKAPFQYRLLFPAIVQGSWQLLTADQPDNEVFFYVYQGWSLFFLITAVISFYFLIQAFGFNQRWRLWGCLFFLISPPVLLAYTLPVHTREDTLGYTLLCVGLLCLMHQRIFLFFLVTLLGVLCRETLLILPFIFLFFIPFRNIAFRTGLAAMPVLLWISLRFWIDGGVYDPLEGLKWNLANLEQVVGFSFITFHFMWLLFFYGLLHRQSFIRNNADFPTQFLFQSGFIIFCLIVITTFIGGIFNEIRLLFLMFPWVIMIALHVLRMYQNRISAALQHKKYQVYLLINVLVFGVACIYLVQHYQQFLDPSRYAIPFQVWIVATFVYVLITVLFIPLYYKIFTRRTIVVKENMRNIISFCLASFLK